jgi:hypothetical protein
LPGGGEANCCDEGQGSAYVGEEVEPGLKHLSISQVKGIKDTILKN